MMKSVVGAGSICLFAWMTACAADGGGSVDQQPAEQVEDTENACVPGVQTACACPDGASSVQLCTDDGSGFGACDCAGDDELTPPDEVPPCGDGTCSEDENCHSCAIDCGTCEPCDVAPSCANAQIPPASLPHAADMDVPAMQPVTPEQMQQRLFDAIVEGGEAVSVIAAALDDTPGSLEHPLVTRLREVFAAHPNATAALKRQLASAGMHSPRQFRAMHPDPKVEDIEWVTHDVDYPGGTMECGSPMLRVGVSKIKVHEEDDDFANDIVYCVVQAETTNGAEIRITPKTPNLDEGDSHTFALESGVFWGQQGPSTPGGNMLITYDCFEADSSTGYQDLVGAIGTAAGEIGEVVEGDNGWIFTTTAAIAPIVSTGLALDSDDHLFNAQQTIPLDRQLELTNGAFWTVRREGTHYLSDWDWELFVNGWGCAEYGTL
jgi:hypothetical protein